MGNTLEHILGLERTANDGRSASDVLDQFPKFIFVDQPAE